MTKLSARLNLSLTVLKIWHHTEPITTTVLLWYKRLRYYITLHWSYLEWFKYKTAKPLLCTVHRTRYRKQLGRKWSGKKISSEAVPKNSQSWSWGDVGQQTVPEAASSHWKRTITNSGQKRMYEDDDNWRRQRVSEWCAGDGSDWNRWCAGCRPCTCTADISKWAQATWNQCVPETAATEGLAASEWRAHTEKNDVLVWWRR